MGLQRKEKDPKFAVHERYWTQAQHAAEIHIVENVSEYDVASYKNHYLGPDSEWGCEVAKIDPRLWGFGCARPRVYAILYNKKYVAWDEDFPFKDVLMGLRAQPVMKASDFFSLSPIPKPLAPGSDLQLSKDPTILMFFGWMWMNPCPLW